MKKIISWNVASIRARMDGLHALLSKENPNIVFLQEIKATEEQFPFFELKTWGYNAYISGQKSWNGVAVLSKQNLQLKSTALPNFEDQARFVEAVDEQGTSYISVYVPNGQAPMNNPQDTSKLEYKLKWMDALYNYLAHLPAFVIGGDFNVIQKDKDVYNPASFQESALMVPPVRAAFERLLTLNMLNPVRDLFPDGGLYTFWDFQGGAWQKNNGIGLDYIFFSKPTFSQENLSANVLKEYRGIGKASDHAPVVVSF